MEEVDLGFVETTENWRLFSCFFPSKFGGKPAWLALKPLPNCDDLKCGTCGKPCVFLMQVYAPVDNTATCFHRTVYLFICKDPACSQQNDSSNFVALRCQLPRQNEFYSSDPPNYSTFDQNQEHSCAAKLEDLCVVCGCAGSKRCAKCHTAAYCSKEHQTVDWKAGHKRNCCQSGKMQWRKYDRQRKGHLSLETT